jgi:hypothetical protein
METKLQLRSLAPSAWPGATEARYATTKTERRRTALVPTGRDLLEPVAVAFADHALMT